MSKEIILFCDESIQKGKHFSNFYGGAAIWSHDFEAVNKALNSKKTELGLHGEVKWTKISAAYRDKYLSLMELFFNFIAADKIKIRIMFTQNMFKPTYEDKLGNSYFKLYFQFIKHAFGLPHANAGGDEIKLRILFDKIPDTEEQAAQFKAFIQGLERNPQFREAKIKIPKEGIGEVVSHDHCILQCLDIVLGAMPFRLNDGCKAIPDGKHRRGKTTVAKDDVYKYINKRIREIYPGFNVGVSTAQRKGPASKWLDPYRHWNFRPSEFEVDKSFKKK